MILVLLQKINQLWSKLLRLFSCLFFYFGFTQDDIEKNNGLFYKISLAGTITSNEEFTFGNDDDETFFKPSALFINNTLGYQFDERSSIGINFEFDRHFEKNLNFFPVFLGFQYNIFDFDDRIFIRGGYGRLVDIGKRFEEGTVYRLGTGVQIFDDNYKNSWLVGFDFTRKRFGFRQTEKLSSVSLFLEFQLF